MAKSTAWVCLPSKQGKVWVRPGTVQAVQDTNPKFCTLFLAGGNQVTAGMPAAEVLDLLDEPSEPEPVPASPAVKPKAAEKPKEVAL